MQWKHGRFSDLKTDDMETLATSIFRKFTRLARDSRVSRHISSQCVVMQSLTLVFRSLPLVSRAPKDCPFTLQTKR